MRLILAFAIACCSALPMAAFSDGANNPYVGVWVFIHGEYQLENGDTIIF